jgi:hypothetical protein
MLKFLAWILFIVVALRLLFEFVAKMLTKRNTEYDSIEAAKHNNYFPYDDVDEDEF